MQRSTTWTLTLGAIWTLVTGGCASAPEGPLTDPPAHELHLSAPPVMPTAIETPRPAPRPAVVVPAHAGPRRTWRYIVIHHSATDRGCAAEFDTAHRKRGWDELGYHFVIDNGRGGPDGRVEVGSRWRSQKWGAHCGGTPNNEYNNHGIGICVVGNFTHRLPSRQQLASLRRLVLDLMQTCDIPPHRIIGHRDAPNAATKCPGDAFDAYLRNVFYPQVRRDLTSASR